jgi:two-component system LytT family response regulator
VTAYDKYALQAFEAGALDYLLKPFEDSRFDCALKRAKERIAERRDSRKGVDRIIIRETGQVSFVKIADIDWIEAADYYACLHAGSKTHLFRRSLSELAEDLKPAFCRIHRSTIVNLDRVESLKLNEEGEYDVLLRSGKTLRLSRGYRKQMQSRLKIHKSAASE